MPGYSASHLRSVRAGDVLGMCQWSVLCRKHLIPGRYTPFIQQGLTGNKNYPFYIGKYTIKKVSGKKEVIYCLPIIVVPVRSVYRQGT